MSFTILGFTISLPLVGLLLALVIGREIWNMTYLRRMGIPGPTPLPFIGHVHKMRKGFHHFMSDCQKKYGNVFSVYLFRNPIICICDLDMLKDITVKSFSKFQNHKTFVLKNKPFDKGMSLLRDGHWKDVRNVVTPTFSALKMKKMSPLINECCDALVKNMGGVQAEKQEVNVNSVFEAFTMDGIAKCAFGLQVDSQNNANDPFVKNAKKIVSGEIFSPLVMLAGVFPAIAHLMNYMNVGMFPASVTNFFNSVVTKSMDMRKENSNERQDFLQLMMNAHKDDDAGQEKIKRDMKEEEKLQSESNEHHDTKFHESGKTQKVKLTTEEVFAQAMFFFLAGYETTNIALSFIAYSMATNPDVQDKLIAEIDEMAPTRDSVDYGSMAKMSYLDCVVCEALRLYPPAALSDRECNETYTYNGITIEKGMQVMYPIFSIQRNPETWPNPEVFDPTRFTKENRVGRHPFAWLPFGSGPRNCVGMRFALLEIKMAAVRLLQKYRFETSPNTEIPVVLGTRSVKPKKGITLRVIDRN